ncbi:DUF4845 domain-containing protein [Marinobacterium sp. AK62]|uniref:DUF4845 domain-containing protein n=1 Tax=Marinobacterium alkalitolerans TaxID=1542925 RepID=A0ABS3Z9J6_9GAMM|nr:DUF4845 domain-containing protein [Marinobacterium alkalitolerans]MBP0048378.1 DUF4845 domain-containing protein [Marinobacterium alkalitolerans]
MNTGVVPFQRGASLLSTLLVLIVAGVFFSVGFKLFTPYKDHATINSIMTNMVSDPEELTVSIREMRSNLDKRFLINQVKLPNREALDIRLEEGVLYFDLKYEVRVPMFYNVDALVTFEEHYEAVKP